MISATMNSRSIMLNVVNWGFGIIAFAIGVVNLLWGNDPGFGIFVIMLSSAYFPPLSRILTQRIGLSIPGILKFLLSVFILWAALGVGELFDKINLMLKDFS